MSFFISDFLYKKVSKINLEYLQAQELLIDISSLSSPSLFSMDESPSSIFELENMRRLVELGKSVPNILTTDEF